MDTVDDLNLVSHLTSPTTNDNSVGNHSQIFRSQSKSISSNVQSTNWCDDGGDYKGDGIEIHTILPKQHYETICTDIFYPSVDAGTNVFYMGKECKDECYIKETIDTTCIEAPTVTLALKTTEFKDPITVIVDTGASISCVSGKIAHKYKHMIKTELRPFQIRTGNGVTTAQKYIELNIHSGKKILYTKFYVLDRIRIDWLIGRKVIYSLDSDVRDSLFEKPGFKEQHAKIRKEYIHLPNWRDDFIDDDDEIHMEDDDFEWLIPRVKDPVKLMYIRMMLNKFKKDLASGEFDIGHLEHTGFMLKIPLTDDRPIALHPYKLPPPLAAELNRQLTKMLQHGIIAFSDSDYAAPVILRPKKSPGEWRIIVDFRRLNKVMKSDEFPLPDMNSMLSSFSGCKWFSGLDLRHGYWNILVDPADRHKTAFITPDGLFEWNRCPMGIKRCPALFQRVMNYLFRDMPYVRVYLDDIVIASKTFEDHMKHVESVMHVIHKYGLKIRADKCTFFTDEIEFLGVTVNAEGIKPTDKSKRKIMDFVQPRNVKQVQQFMGVVQWVGKWIPGLSDQMRYISALQRKNVKFFWTGECEDAFQRIRDLVKKSNILIHPDYTKPFYIYCDASSYAIGAVLCQKDKDDNMRPVEFASRMLTETQQKWHCSEQEIYAAVWSIEKWRKFLYASKFYLYTDHKNLEELFNKAKDFKSGKLYRWSIRLQEYDFNARYLEGEKNLVADYLSRYQPELQSGYKPTKADFDVREVAHYIAETCEIPFSCEQFHDTYILDKIANESTAQYKGTLFTGAIVAKCECGRQLDYILCSGWYKDGAQCDYCNADVDPTAYIYHCRSRAHEHDYCKKCIELDAINPHVMKGQNKATYEKMKKALIKVNEKINKTAKSNITEVEMKSHDEDDDIDMEIFEPKINNDLNKSRYFPTSPSLYKHKYAWDDLTPKLIYEKQLEDPICNALIKALSDNTTVFMNFVPQYIQQMFRKHYFRFENNMLKYVLRQKHNNTTLLLPYIPPQLRTAFLFYEHKQELHHGVTKLYSSLKTHMYWIGMHNDIKIFCASCKECSMCKDPKARNKSKFMQLFPAKMFNEVLHIDIVGPLPETASHNRYLLTMMDRYSKFVMAVPMQDMFALTVIKKLSAWLAVFTQPQSIISDQGSQFLSEIFTHFISVYDVNHRMTTPYHPMSNGQIERFHRYMKERLKLLSAVHELDFISRDDWDDYIPYICYVYNSTPSVATGKTPCELAHGYKPILPIDFKLDALPDVPNYDEFVRKLKQINDKEARVHQKRYDEIRKRAYDKNQTAPYKYVVGDLVLHNIIQTMRTKAERSLKPNWCGPYKIVKIWNDGHSLSLSAKNGDRFTVYVTNVKLYKRIPDLMSTSLLKPFVFRGSENEEINKISETTPYYVRATCQTHVRTSARKTYSSRTINNRRKPADVIPEFKRRHEAWEHGANKLSVSIDNTTQGFDYNEQQKEQVKQVNKIAKQNNVIKFVYVDYKNNKIDKSENCENLYSIVESNVRIKCKSLTSKYQGADESVDLLWLD